MISTLLRILVARLTRNGLGRAMRPAVRVNNIHLAFDNPALLNATYGLKRIQEETGDRFAFGALSPVLRVANVSADKDVLQAEDAKPAGRTFVSFKSQQPFVDASVSFNLEWNSARPRQQEQNDSVLILPDMLPELIGVQDDLVDGTALPVIRVKHNALGSMTFGGLQVARSQSDTHAQKTVDYYDVVIVAHGKALKPVENEFRSGIVITDGLASQFSVAELEYVSKSCRQIYAFLTELFGTSVLATLVLRRPGEARSPQVLRSGTSMVAGRAAFGLGSDDSIAEPSDRFLAMQMAGIWWGGGCRLVGPRARELELAMRTAAALMWVERIGEPGAVSTAITVLRDRMGVRQRESWVRWINDRYRPWVAIRHGERLFTAMHENQQVQDVVRAFLSTHWGRYASADTLRADLAAVDVSFSR